MYVLVQFVVEACHIGFEVPLAEADLEERMESGSACQRRSSVEANYFTAKV
jgi:hypothetical protein